MYILQLTTSILVIDSNYHLIPFLLDGIHTKMQIGERSSLKK